MPLPEVVVFEPLALDNLGLKVLGALCPRTKGFKSPEELAQELGANEDEVGNRLTYMLSTHLVRTPKSGEDAGDKYDRSWRGEVVLHRQREEMARERDDRELRLAAFKSAKHQANLAIRISVVSALVALVMLIVTLVRG